MIHFFEQFIQAHGAVAVLVVGILEDILFIVPSALVFMGAGFFLVPQRAPFGEAFVDAVMRVGLPAAVGVTFGALVIYWVVYVGGKAVIDRWGKYVGVSWGAIEQIERRFTAGYSDEVILFLARALPIFPLSVVTVFCGLIRLPWQEFTLYTFLGTLVRASGAALLGWAAGRSYVYYADQFAAVEDYVLIGLLLIGVVLYWYYRVRPRDSD